MKRMMVCSMTLFLCLAILGLAQERRVSGRNVPAAVAAAAAKAYPNAKIKSWSRETEGGKTFYEAEMTDGAVKRDILLLPDGTIDIVEEEIPTIEVPAAVHAALKTRYPKAEINLAEKLTKDGAVQYELHIKKASKKEVVFTPEGKFVKEE